MKISTGVAHKNPWQATNNKHRDEWQREQHWRRELDFHPNGLTVKEHAEGNTIIIVETIKVAQALDSYPKQTYDAPRR